MLHNKSFRALFVNQINEFEYQATHEKAGSLVDYNSHQPRQIFE